jgi:hypothetical protein
MTNQIPNIQAILREEDIRIFLSSVEAQRRARYGQSPQTCLMINEVKLELRARKAASLRKVWLRRRDGTPVGCVGGEGSVENLGPAT